MFVIRLLRYFMDGSIKVLCVASKMKENSNGGAAEVGPEQNTLAKSVTTKHYPVTDWMEPVISITPRMGMIVDRITTLRLW